MLLCILVPLPPQHLFDLHAYNTLLAVVGGLNHFSIRRLTQTWAKVDKTKREVSLVCWFHCVSAKLSIFTPLPLSFLSFWPFPLTSYPPSCPRSWSAKLTSLALSLTSPSTASKSRHLMERSTFPYCEPSLFTLQRFFHHNSLSHAQRHCSKGPCGD